MVIRYSHCVRATCGELDRYPHTEYETRLVEATLWHIGENNEDDGYFVVVDGERFDSGDTPQDAEFEASYALMQRSRSAGYAADRIRCDMLANGIAVA